ncbi:hypothetical protein GFPCMMHI_06595 [Ensifer adhaerens]|nr:hypothetical protein [Ensifer adhaerens]
MATEFRCARSRGQGKFWRHQVAARRPGRTIPDVNEIGSTGDLRYGVTHTTRFEAAPSERWLGIDAAIHLGNRQRESCLCQIEFGFDLAALARVDSVTQFGTKLFDLAFEFVGHRLISYVKDDQRRRIGNDDVRDR